jgi:hypothetical protein
MVSERMVTYAVVEDLQNLLVTGLLGKGIDPGPS